MKRFLTTIVIAFALFGAAKAIVVQKITLKNGSELNGYIQQQDGSNKLTFHTDNAIIYVNSVNVEIFDRKVNVNALDAAWKEWAEKNDAFEGIGDGRTLTLSDLTVQYNFATVDSVAVAPAAKGFEEFLKENHRHLSSVKVLERGVKVKYLELTPNSYTLSWDDIVSIKSDRRAKTALSGINRIYELRNGKTYEGQYAEETDNVLSLYMDNGMIQSFKLDDVIKYTFYPINPNQDLFEQSELLDVVRTNNGSLTRGIIVEQNYASKKDTENYLLIRMESGAIQSIKVSDIRELSKEENPRFSPKFDIALNEGDIVINRQETAAVKVTEKDDLLVLDSLPSKVVLTKGANNTTKVMVEYRLENTPNLEAFQLVRVTESTVRRQHIFSFSYKDLVNAAYRPLSLETSINKTTKAEYQVGGTGIFALYDAKKKLAIPFIVQ